PARADAAGRLGEHDRAAVRGEDRAGSTGPAAVAAAGRRVPALVVEVRERAVRVAAVAGAGGCGCRGAGAVRGGPRARRGKGPGVTSARAAIALFPRTPGLGRRTPEAG